MRAWVVLACAVVLAVVTQGQHGCQAPEEWEARTYLFDHHQEVFLRGHLSYDKHGERARFIEDVDVNGTRSAYDNIYLYQKHMHYRIDLKTKKCEKIHLNHTFIPIEVHPNSTFYGESIIGSLSAPGMGVIVQSWGHEFTGGFELQTFTAHGCYPIQSQYFNETVHSKVDYDYVDLTPGIKDRAVFEPPKECM